MEWSCKEGSSETARLGAFRRSLSWVRIFFSRQELLGAKEDRPCSRNWPVLGLIDWLGRQKTVSAGLVVFTDGIKLGGGMLPSEDGEADNDRMRI